jgi:hypothetical protein
MAADLPFSLGHPPFALEDQQEEVVASYFGSEIVERVEVVANKRVAVGVQKRPEHTVTAARLAYEDAVSLDTIEATEVFSIRGRAYITGVIAPILRA